MGATTVAAALSDFQAISQTVGTLKGGTVGADNLAVKMIVSFYYPQKGKLRLSSCMLIQSLNT